MAEINTVDFEEKIPERLWLPLYILDNTKFIETEAKLQKLTFLIQEGSDLNFYDFQTHHHYGPYSDTLKIDAFCYRPLISYELSPYHKEGQYFIFMIGDTGKKTLESLNERIFVKKAAFEKARSSLRKYLKLNNEDLLEEVYSTFRSMKKENQSRKLNRVNSELLEVKPPLLHTLQKYRNRQSFFLLSILDTVEAELDAVKDSSNALQREVVLGLSHEIIHKCKQGASSVTPPADSQLLKSLFVEIAELEHFLRRYCDKRGILKDPLKQPLEDTMTEDEAERAASALRKMDITA